jgi:subtilisin family serine protease
VTGFPPGSAVEDDLVVPGERIFSCHHDFKKGGKTEKDLYVEMSGTSMAAPHVSGLLAATGRIVGSSSDFLT